MSSPSKEFNLEEYILHHMQNGYQWNLPFLPPIELPSMISLHALMILFGTGGLLLLFGAGYRYEQKVPSGITNALEAIVLFIRDKIAIPNLGQDDGRKFTPFLCTLFFFILILNLLSMIPLFSTATGNINVTTSLALIIFSFMTFGAIQRKGILAFFKSFLIPGIAWPMQLIIVLLEILGLFTRTFALTIRLFANMLAGHMVVLAFLGLVALFGWAILPVSIGLAVFILLLEVLVVFLQAYIFTLLAAIFIGQAYSTHH
ncbi:MAG: F0F1 ATP synthase subunit A [Candidatus Omnitrophica bacterium]|nr:F0F1 ATP synthase subunit A [Candidatus Omnitrophota bacterium]